jgi:hypothetical protein
MAWHPDTGIGTIVLSNSNCAAAVQLCDDALIRALAARDAPSQTIDVWATTAGLVSDIDQLVRAWDDRLAKRIFAENVEMDRSLHERRRDLNGIFSEIGRLVAPPLMVASPSPAEAVWLVQAERGHLLGRIRVTPVHPTQIQKLELKGVGSGGSLANELAKMVTAQPDGVTVTPALLGRFQGEPG